MSASGDPTNRTVYTVGHSTRSVADFVAILQAFEIQEVVDIRRFPGSRKFPGFNQENLARELREVGIDYLHLEALGGRRVVQPGSHNGRWRSASFRGYADYMETAAFAGMSLRSLKRLVVEMC